MITCRDFVDFVMRYLEGELPPEQEAEFRGHMGICPSCIDYLDSYKATQKCCKKLCEDDDELPADVPESLIQAILKAKERSGG
ncbi:MAG: anti-sigma factor family protein [Planctomycetota bacterium]|jgi:anti-sigma factor RsiW